MLSQNAAGIPTTAKPVLADRRASARDRHESIAYAAVIPCAFVVFLFAGIVIPTISKAAAANVGPW